MSRIITAYFPTHIYFSPLNTSFNKTLNNDLISEAQRLREVDDEGVVWSHKNYKGGYTSYGSRDHLHLVSSTFGDLEKQIRKHVRRFAKHLQMDLQGRSLCMTDCWVNALNKGGTHSAHIHPLSVISGTYYAQVPKKVARIKFEDPRMQCFMAAPPKLTPTLDRNLQHIAVTPKAGYLVLFESWLRHEVEPHPGDEPRISISFNYA